MVVCTLLLKPTHLMKAESFVFASLESNAIMISTVFQILKNGIMLFLVQILFVQGSGPLTPMRFVKTLTFLVPLGLFAVDASLWS